MFEEIHKIVAWLDANGVLTAENLAAALNLRLGTYVSDYEIWRIIELNQ
jgi:hypothetical protein